MWCGMMNDDELTELIRREIDEQLRTEASKILSQHLELLIEMVKMNNKRRLME